MKKSFREYHQFTATEFDQLFKNCLFVFDANTLLNMYRYSRETVNSYMKVLAELKNKGQLWIPYQIGYEFYENSIGVISEYEKSYDEILSILDDAKKNIENKYKNHPFLDLVKIKEEMNAGLSKVESKIKIQKNNHPKWLEGDDVMEKINELFEGSVGENYTDKKIGEIKKEGEARYAKKIPPGFKDNQKAEDKKYGDLILWFQIIDKAKKSKKPIILISGDVKDDWWLERDGKRIMPLPQLKKEMLDKSGVDFHIYTADRFLELYKIPSQEIDEKTIKEVRKIRELEEERMRIRMEAVRRERDFNPVVEGRYFAESIHLFEMLQELMINTNELEISPGNREELSRLFHRLREL
jgi:hypothetical protein